MNIIITAGGTSEYIDKVRKITNSGTGKLGSIITNTILQRDDIDKVMFIVDRNDLDYQTTKEFNSFCENSVDGTDNTRIIIFKRSIPALSRLQLFRAFG